MSKILDYYKNYHKDCNTYRMSDWRNTSRVAFLIEFIKKFAKPGDKILDVGCGDMYLAKTLPEYQWTGLDANQYMTTEKVVVQDLESYPWEVEPGFDLIICSEVLEHLFDPLAVTKEIRRLLKPDGTYIVSTPNFDWIDHYLGHFRQVTYDEDRHWTKEHIRQYTIGSHEQILNRAGFDLLEFIGADAHYSQFFAEGRVVLRSFLESSGVADPEFTTTDQLIGAMFKQFNHTIICVAKPKA